VSKVGLLDSPRRRRALATLTGLPALALLLVGFAPASAQAARSPWWHISSEVRPANLPPGGEGLISIQAVNVGDAPTSGTIALSDVLPAGVSVAEEEVGGELVPAISLYYLTSAFGLNLNLGANGPFRHEFAVPACSVVGATVSCSLGAEGQAFLNNQLQPGAQNAKPFQSVEMRIKVRVDSAASSGVQSRVTVSGGGAPPTSLGRGFDIGATAPAFGAEYLSQLPEEEGGAIDTRAGSHPFQLTTTFSLNQNESPYQPPALPRNLSFQLPPGLIGNATALPQCTEQQFDTIEGVGTANACAADSAVGVATVTFDEPDQLKLQTKSFPLFNLAPTAGEPARFGFEFAHAPITLDTAVRTGGDYGVTVNVNNITELTNLLSSTVTFWGVPGDSRHDEARGWECLSGGELDTNGAPCNTTSISQPPPFLTLPSSCSLPFTTSVEGSAWPTQASPAGDPLQTAEHGSYSLQDEFARPLLLTGCNQLPFAPEFDLKPERTQASTPSGVTAEVHVPQEQAASADGLAPSDIKSTTVVLPAGVQVNAASAGGLQACSQAQASIDNASEATCPEGSKLANVTITTPVLANPLKGSVYLASPQNFATGPRENPFGTLLAAYLIAKDPVSGVLVKLAGEGKLNETTGQITLGFESPQVPFEDAKFEFFGGERAPVATPAHCGAYTTSATLTPWSETAALNTTSSFNITSGPGGGPCPAAALPFAPTLAVGTTNNNAGTFSPLTTTIGREDGEQFINSVTLHMPPGAGGAIAGIPRCAEAQANAGACSPQSLIGHATASVGIGKEPFTVTGGQVFLTESYKGAPFGLSIVTPAVAGPFNLGNVIVRARIEVNPATAALTVITDEIPHILKGIPLEIKRVNVTVDRPNLTFNPTNCNALTATGAIGAVEGASAAVSEPFQASNCAALKFAPKFSASTSGKTSKANGASLRVKIVYPSGGQANISKVDLTIPAILPTRLTTIQKACTEAQFNSNPAGCPAASVIATATVHTPVLSSPLTGPVYFVSHGGAAFPDVEMVLSGEGVTLVVDGKTQIKKGVTFSHFETVPDEPFTSFEFLAPQGPHSIFTANGNLCASQVAMATTLTAQNGALLTQSTPVTVEGCNSLQILSHSIKKRTLTIKVAVPSAGRLTATAKGMSKASKTAKGRSTVTLTLKAKAGGKLKARVKLSFAPSTGRKLAAAVTARFAR
jgi:hypothetical protein